MSPALCFCGMSLAGLCAVPHLHAIPRRTWQAPEMNPFVPFSLLCVFNLFLSLDRRLAHTLPVPLSKAVTEPHPAREAGWSHPHQLLPVLPAQQPGCLGWESRQGLVEGEILSSSLAGACCKPEVLISLCSSCTNVLPLLP